MKVIKGLAIFLFFTILLDSCFDPPDFPDTPQISLNDIVFKVNENNEQLIITLNFTDGDGDLGLDPGLPQHADRPFQSGNFFQTDAAGNKYEIDVIPVVVNRAGQTSIVDMFDLPDPSRGPLLFYSARREGFPTLPEFDCDNYVYKSFLIPVSDSLLLGSTSMIEDTLVSSATEETYWEVSDSLYVELNPNHYNIEVDILKKVGENFEELDLRSPPFCSTFDGRFPVLSDDDDTSLEGTLSYTLESAVFSIRLGDNPIKLKIRIKDRALNVSNEIETEPFRLGDKRPD